MKLRGFRDVSGRGACETVPGVQEAVGRHPVSVQLASWGSLV